MYSFQEIGGTVFYFPEGSIDRILKMNTRPTKRGSTVASTKNLF